MIGHLSFGVRDLARATAFYDAAMGALGFRRVWDSPKGVGYGLETGKDKLAFFPKVDAAPPGPGFHLAFDAASRDAVDRFHAAYRPAGRRVAGAARAEETHGADAATRRRARGWAAVKALACLLIGDAGDHGRPGGKPTWGPPARASLERLTATSAR